MKLRMRIITIAFLTSMLALVQMPMSHALYTETPPVLDGIIGVDEWGDPTFESEGYFDVYVLNDAGYLYIAFEAEGGTYLPTGEGDIGMMNAYIHNLETDETWAYTWIHRTPDLIELYYSPPRTQRSTAAVFAVSETVFELQIPLSEQETIELGDTIGFHFLSFSEGLTDWTTCWLPYIAEDPVEYTLAEPPPEVVEIDIKPGSDPNSINLKSKGVVPVAILTTEDFDASTVDPVTVIFAGAEPVRWSWDDVDRDGDDDLILHFKTQELELDENSTEATLTGSTSDGTIEGTDTVNIVPKGK